MTPDALLALSGDGEGVDACVHESVIRGAWRSIFCPTGATMSSSPALAAATAVGETWPSRAGAKMPPATCGARPGRARSGDGRVRLSCSSPPCAPRRAMRPSSRRPAPNSASATQGTGYPYPDHRVAGGRRGAAPGHHHESHPQHARHRADQLCGGGAGEHGRRLGAPSLRATSLCRRNWCARRRRCSARVARVFRRTGHPGCCT